MSRKLTVNAFDYFSSSEGCFLKDGKLTQGYAAANTFGKLPQDVVFVTYSPASCRYFACSLDATFVSGDGENFVKLCDCGSGAPFLIEDYYKDMPRSIVVTGGSATMYYGNTHTVAILPVSLYCGAMHCGRVFGADSDDGFLLRWSGADGIEDWNGSLSGSGCLHLGTDGGKITDILPFGSKLAVLRQRGITILNMQSEPEKFSVGFNHFQCAGVVANTACVLNGKLYFFTATGLKVFDGSNILSVPFRHSDELVSPHSCIVYDGRYFVACKSKLRGGVIACIDFESGESSLIGTQAERLFLKDGVVFSDFSVFGKIAEAGKFSFETSEINFGTGREKTLTEALINGVCDIEISNGKRSRKFLSAGGLIRPKLRGKSFKIKLTGKSEIFKIMLTAEALNAI